MRGSALVGIGRGRLWAVVAALAVSAATVVTTTVAAPSPASAADPAPAVGDPGVMAPVDLSALDPNPIAQWGVVGSGVTTSTAKPQVWDFAEIGDRIYVGGNFTGVKQNAAATTQSQAYLAAFDRDSGAWISTFRPTFNATVLSLAVSPSGNLLVGGEFTAVNGAARTGLVMLDATTGATVSTFGAQIRAANNPSVRRIIRDGNQFYVAGQISTVVAPNGSPWVWNAARLDATTGAIDLTWIPKYMGGVWSIAVDKGRGRVHAAGFFTSVDGQPNTALVATVSAAGGVLVPGLTKFTPNDYLQTWTTSIGYGEGRIFTGGAQHSVQVLDGSTNNRLGWVQTGTTCTAFDFESQYQAGSCFIFGGGDMQVMRVAAGGTVLVGCHCYQPYPNHVAQWTNKEIYSSFTNSRLPGRFVLAFQTANGRPSTSFIPNLREPAQWGTYALFTDTRGCLYVGGDYSSSSSGQWLGGFGRFCAPAKAPVSLSGSSVNQAATLTWQASPGPLAAKYYKVYRNGSFLGDTTGLTYGTGGLTVGTSYRFTVRTVDAAGRLSPEVGVDVVGAGADTQAPTVPASPTAAVNGSDVTVGWGASTDLPDPGGIGLSGYLVHRDYQFLRFVPAGTTAFTDTGLTAGTHRYEIRAVDRANNWSTAAVVNATIADTQAPTTPANAAGTVGARTVTLTWSASTDLPDPGGIGLSGYLVHRDYQFLTFVPAGTTTFADTNVAVGSHRYEIRAVDRNNNWSPPTSPIFVTVG